MGFWSKVSGIFGGKGAPKTREQLFVDFCVAELRDHPAVAHVAADEGPELPVNVRLNDGGEQRLFLKNTFFETRELAPEQKLAAVRRLFDSLSMSHELSWDDAAPAIVPLVRITTFGGGMADNLVSLPLAPFVRIFLGVDRETTTSYVTQDMAKGWQQTPAEILTQGLANLSAHVLAASADEPDLEPYDTDAPYPIWHVTRNDSYETSRLALPGYLASLRDKVRGNPIAIAPHRSLLVVSGDGDAAAIARLAEMAESEFNASPRSISSAVYTVNDADEVVPLELLPEHPQYQRVRRGHRILAASSYADQKAKLEAEFAKTSTDIFVASLSVVETQQGEIRSYCVMSQGVDTLLPEADAVALVFPGKKGEHFMVRWHELFEVAPGCLERAADYEPPRFRTLSFPNAETVLALRQHAID